MMKRRLVWRYDQREREREEERERDDTNIKIQKQKEEEVVLNGRSLCHGRERGGQHSASKHHQCMLSFDSFLLLQG